MHTQKNIIYRYKRIYIHATALEPTVFTVRPRAYTDPEHPSQNSGDPATKKLTRPTLRKRVAPKRRNPYGFRIKSTAAVNFFWNYNLITVVPPYPLIQYPLFTAARIEIVKLKKYTVHNFQNECQAETSRNMVKSSSSNAPSTLLIFLRPRTHAKTSESLTIIRTIERESIL
jgi:hypothetical protein